MLWLSLNFYQLPLDVFSNQQLESNSQSVFAVVENGVLAFCNQNAANQGLSPRMKISTAYALSRELKVKQRNHQLEQNRLVQLATIAYEFSSQVCIYNSQTILLEVEASCKLFTDLSSLLVKLTNRFSEQAVCFYSTLAATPKAAYLLGCYEKKTIEEVVLTSANQKVLDINRQTIKRLENIPVSFLSYDHECQLAIKLEKIKKMGINYLAELFKLPASAIGKRFGQSFLKYLYCLKGEVNDPQVLFELPEKFSMQRCFVGGLDSVDQIMFPARVMLDGLIDFLNLRRVMTTKISWHFTCFNGEELIYEINLSSENQTLEQLMMLTKLKLQAVILKDKIEMVFLKSESFVVLKEKQACFELGVAQSNGMNRDDFHVNDMATLMDKINVRLGSDKCHKLYFSNEHLPEKLSSNRESQHRLDECIDTNEYVNEQPLWLLDRPEAIQIHSCNQSIKLNYKGELLILSRAEIIESDWWHHYQRREYYIAKNNQGVRYWIYSDLEMKQWWLHGVF